MSAKVILDLVKYSPEGNDPILNYKNFLLLIF